MVDRNTSRIDEANRNVGISLPWLGSVMRTYQADLPHGQEGMPFALDWRRNGQLARAVPSAFEQPGSVFEI
jgi:hypothetical protein